MKIGPDTVVALKYNLYDEAGELIESTREGEPFVFAFGLEQIIPGLEKGLEGLEPGATVDVIVAPEEGYGPREPELIQQVCREQFPEEIELEIGRSYRAVTDGGTLMFFVILGYDEENVEIDLNHPLAGATLRFEVEVLDVSSNPDKDGGAEGPQLWTPGSPS
jgi:FKBP-type peptidyl-prolyl cis-trans isomerase SlyD